MRMTQPAAAKFVYFVVSRQRRGLRCPGCSASSEAGSGQPTAARTSRWRRRRRPLGSATPRAFVIDDEDGICKLIMMTLATMGVEAKKFHTAADAVAALDRRAAGDHLPRRRAAEVRRDRRDPRARRARLWRHRAADERQQCRAAGGRAARRRAPRPQHAPAALEAIPRRGDPSRHHQRASRREPRSRVVGLDEALAKGWLELWYQPKIDLRSNSLAGAEGLIRCRHPVHGMLSPASFLPGASESSHAALTEHVIITALRDWDEIAADRRAPACGGQHLDRRARQPAAARADPRASLEAAPTGPA